MESGREVAPALRCFLASTLSPVLLHSLSAGSNGPAGEVSQILEMWSAIERGYKRLSADEKDQVEAEAGPLGRGVRFSGFDDETEHEYRDAARHLIKDLNSFDRFQRRNLSAHMPTLHGRQETSPCSDSQIEKEWPD